MSTSSGAHGGWPTSSEARGRITCCVRQRLPPNSGFDRLAADAEELLRLSDWRYRNDPDGLAFLRRGWTPPREHSGGRKPPRLKQGQVVAVYATDALEEIHPRWSDHVRPHPGPELQ